VVSSWASRIRCGQPGTTFAPRWITTGEMEEAEASHQALPSASTACWAARRNALTGYDSAFASRSRCATGKTFAVDLNPGPRSHPRRVRSVAM
jgi:hypothetical protein